MDSWEINKKINSELSQVNLKQMWGKGIKTKHHGMYERMWGEVSETAGERSYHSL